MVARENREECSGTEADERERDIRSTIETRKKVFNERLLAMGATNRLTMKSPTKSMEIKIRFRDGIVWWSSVGIRKVDFEGKRG